MYSSHKNANIVISRLRHDFAISEWFYEHYMVLNADKCHFLTVYFNKPFPDFSFNDTAVENVTKEKILGIVIDNKLNLKSHLKNICKKASQQISTPSRISFNHSQFSYCHFIWMFTSKGVIKESIENMKHRSA